ncbi:UNVERIFIED_CONTAM: hypothetical protein GTU68_010505 [Idotea baltica]|nr:hypothetical protein [Idotea baltica]
MFEQKTAWITGAASGIGRATAIEFAEKGAQVVVSDVNVAGGEETVEMIEKAGGKAVFIKCDVSKAEVVVATVKAIVDQFGSLDIGVNNAGIGGPFIPTAEYDHESYRQVMAVNLDGVFFCMQEEIKQMLKQGSGAIVNISSIAGMRGLPRASAYSASKHAVIGLTKAASLEYARHKVRINAVCPVFTRSAMFDSMFMIDPTYEEKLKKAIPMRRYGQPEDIAHAITWLCSDQAGFVTGMCMPMDGGMTAG